MHSLSFEDVFPIAREVARQKALSIVGRCGLTPADREDIEGQLLFTFYLRFPKFDARRASVRTFASRVMDKELVSILRYRQAFRRRCSLAPASLEELNETDHGTAMVDGPSPAQRRQFWLDVDRALASRSELLHETALVLCWDSPSEMSRTLGRSRTAIYGRIRRLREAFMAAGIGPTYFTSFGVEQ